MRRMRFPCAGAGAGAALLALLMLMGFGAPVGCATRPASTPDAAQTDAAQTDAAHAQTHPAEVADGRDGTGSVPATTQPLPTAEAIAASERARVGALSALHARGVAELRTTDEQGAHFDQGDLDFRWMPGRGFAASVAKFGDRWAWIGSDGVRWWSFELKADPVTLRIGRLDGVRASTAAVMPWLMAIRPLLPAAEAPVQWRKERACVRIDVAQTPMPAGTIVEAEFDPRTLVPLAVRVRRGDALVCESTLAEIGSVETLGLSQGAWPRLPRRVRASAADGSAGLELAIFFDSMRGDREAVDKPSLYDLDALRTRFDPKRVEDDAP